MLSLVFGFCMWRLTLDCGVLFLLSAEYSVIMCRAWPGTLVTWSETSSQYDILLCSETLVSDMHHMSELLVPRFGHPVMLCWFKMPWAGESAAYV